MIPTLHSAIRSRQACRRSRSWRDRGIMWLTLIGSPVSGSGMRQTAAASCCRSKREATKRAAPAKAGWPATSLTRSSPTQTRRSSFRPRRKSSPVRAGMAILRALGCNMSVSARRRGSSRSRRASPSMLKASTTMLMASPGRWPGRARSRDSGAPHHRACRPMSESGWRAEPEEAEGGLDDDGIAEPDRRDDQDGREHVGQDVAEHDPPRRGPDGIGRIDERVLLDGQDGSSHHAGGAGCDDDGDDDDHVDAGSVPAPTSRPGPGRCPGRP